MNALFVYILVGTVGTALAGIRCSIGGDALCTLGCVILGQTSGICDAENTCHCSEKSISLQDIKDIIPSRCDLGEGFCQASCNAIGRRTGICSSAEGGQCECDTEFLTPEEFALCGTSASCTIYCQARGFATGDCDGWKCNCASNKEDSLFS